MPCIRLGLYERGACVHAIDERCGSHCCGGSGDVLCTREDSWYTSNARTRELIQ